MDRSSLALLGLALMTACRGAPPGDGAPEKRESPQASAEPALLAAGPTQSAMTTPLAAEGGPPPVPFRGDEVLASDALTKEAAGYTLSAVLRPADVTGPSRSPEVSGAGLDAARKATDLRMTIDLSPTRLRVALGGQGFVLPPDSEIRARSDRYGHVVLWSGMGSYRPLAPGSMRALLGERRFDVAPITPAELELRGDGGRRVGVRTRKAEVKTRAASATFEIGKLDGAGEGGMLLCRLLLDLMNAPPGSGVCALDEVPVRVELEWTNKGSLVFEVTRALRRVDIPASALLVPPATAAYATASIPVAGIAPMLDEQELGALRTGDVDMPSVPDAAEDELVMSNPTVELRLLFLDGVPVAWAAPGARGPLRGLRRGRYLAQWRTFLGDAVEAPVTQPVPGISQVGGLPDAGE